MAHAWNPSTSQAEAGGSWGAQADPIPKTKEKRSERKRKKRKLTFLTAKLISRVILKQRLFMVKF